MCLFLRRGLKYEIQIYVPYNKILALTVYCNNTTILQKRIHVQSQICHKITERVVKQVPDFSINSLHVTMMGCDIFIYKL